MYARLRKPDMTDEEKAAARQEYIDFQNGPVWGGWRTETVQGVPPRTPGEGEVATVLSF